MPDQRLPKGDCDRPPGRTTKRKRFHTTNFDITVDTDSQDNRFKRQINDDGHDNLRLNPSYQTHDKISKPTTSTEERQPSLLPAPLLGPIPSQAVPKRSDKESSQSVTLQQFQPVRFTTLPSGFKYAKYPRLASEPQPQKQSSVAPALQSSNSPTSSPIGSPATPEPQAPGADTQPHARNDPTESAQQWEPKEWDEYEFDSDDENMSLAVTIKLANELSLLKSFLDLYRTFNIHLGDHVSGPRHNGFLTLIFTTVARLTAHAARLHHLRHTRQRGDPAPSALEAAADDIARGCCAGHRQRRVWAIMGERVDMADDGARAAWVRRKRAVLGEVMGGMAARLEGLGRDGGEGVWRGMAGRWERRWRAYGALGREELRGVGWVLDVAGGR